MNFLQNILLFFHTHIQPLMMAVPFQQAYDGDLDGAKMTSLAKGDYGSAGQQVADYYLSFGHYLNVTQPIGYWFTSILGWLNAMLYYIAKALITVFVELFNLFTLSSDGQNGTSKVTELAGWLKDFGTAVFALSLIFTFAVIVINPQKAHSKLKQVAINTSIITFMVAAIPWATPQLANGIKTIAQNVLVGQNGNGQTQSVDSIADRIVKTNVIDLPDVSLKAVDKGGELPSYVNHDQGNKIFVNADDFSDNIPVKQFMINESFMSDDQLNTWSGFNGTDAGDFLLQVGASDNNLNNDTLTHMKAAQSRVIQDIKSRMKKLGYDDSFWGDIKSFAKNTWDAINPFGDKQKSVDIVLNTFHMEMDAFKILFGKDSAEKKFSFLTYHPAGLGDNATFSQFTQFSKSTSGGIFNLTPGGAIKSALAPAFYESYVRYSVNWFSITLGLMFIIAAMLVYIFKLVKTWFKMLYMYVSAYLVIAKHISNGEKVKEFVYNFFGLFEVLLADVVTLYLLFTVYPILNQVIQGIMFGFHSAALGNPITSALVTFVADMALFQVGMNGIEAINSQIGGKANEAGHTQSLLQTLTALKVAGAASKVPGQAAKTGMALGGAGKGLYDWNKGRKQRKAKLSSNGLGNNTMGNDSTIKPPLTNPNEDDKDDKNNNDKKEDSLKDSTLSSDDVTVKGGFGDNGSDYRPDDSEEVKSDDSSIKDAMDNDEDDSDKEIDASDDSSQDNKNGSDEEIDASDDSSKDDENSSNEEVDASDDSSNDNENSSDEKIDASDNSSKDNENSSNEENNSSDNPSKNDGNNSDEKVDTSNGSSNNNESSSDEEVDNSSSSSNDNETDSSMDSSDNNQNSNDSSQVINAQSNDNSSIKGGEHHNESKLQSNDNSSNSKNNLDGSMGSSNDEKYKSDVFPEVSSNGNNSNHNTDPTNNNHDEVKDTEDSQRMNNNNKNKVKKDKKEKDNKKDN